jgi:hypothetical protein
MLRHTLLSDGWKSWALLNRGALLCQKSHRGTQDDAELHSLSVPSVEPECASLPGLTCHCPNSCALSAAS